MSGNDLYKHQSKAVDKFKDSTVIPLFFDPGLGKSRTILEIAKYKYRQGSIDALLIIAPNKVHEQWAREQIPLWLVDIDTVVTYRKNVKKLPFVKGKLNIVCINIDTFSTKTKYVEYVEWSNTHSTMIVLDEATKIKNPKAVRTQRLLYEFNTIVKRGRSIIKSEPKTVARAILTGTPVTNGSFDVWSMFEFLQPGYFGLNWYAFQNKYGIFYSMQVNGRVIHILINEDSWKMIKACSTWEMANALYGISFESYNVIQSQDEFKGAFKNTDSLIELINKTALFAKVEDCLDMPERTYSRKLIDMEPEQSRVYYEMERDLLSMYKGEEVSAKTKIAAYIRLQQIASGFVSTEQIPENEIEDPPPNKITWFDRPGKIHQLLNDIEEIEGQCIIVCHFSAEADRIYNELIDKGYKCCLMTGWKKVGSIDAFKVGKYKIMVANIRVISMGFNLQEHCHHMIFYSNTFSLEDRIQVEARIYRSGQKNTCIYIDYVSTDTIDMKIYAALKQKKDLADYITNKSIESMLTEQDEVFKEEYERVIF